MTLARVAGARVLVVLAHPDDESLACGGTIARLTAAGARVRVVCATTGAAGHMNPTVVTDRASLAGVRRVEFERACALLGVHDFDLLPFRDGLLSWFDGEPLIAWLSACMRDWRPEALITFGRDGLYWHPDHIALGERVRTSVAQCARDVAVAAYAVVMPPGAMATVAAETARQVPGVVPAFWGVAPDVFGKGALPATRVINVATVLGAKLAALQAHASQLDDANPLARLTPDIAAPLAVEHFHLLETSPMHRSALDALASA